MANLLRLIVDLVEDEDVRSAFRTDPDLSLADFDDLCGEDVAAAVDVARVQVEPVLAERLTRTLATSPGRGETPRDVARRSLLSVCDAVEEAEVFTFPSVVPDYHETSFHEAGDRPHAPDHPSAAGTGADGDDYPSLVEEPSWSEPSWSEQSWSPPYPGEPDEEEPSWDDPVWDDPGQTGRRLPDRPPGLGRKFHLWSVGDAGSAEDTTTPPPRLGSVGRTPSLAPVPDPPGGFEFSVLEMVELPAGLPQHGIEPGALATVVAVHREPELSYEIEVNDDDGARRFLGIVPTSAVGRLR